MLGMDKKRVAMLIVKKPGTSDNGNDSSHFVDKGDHGSYSDKEEYKAPPAEDESGSYGHEAAMEDLITCFKSGDAHGALKAWANLNDMGKLPRKEEEEGE